MVAVLSSWPFSCNSTNHHRSSKSKDPITKLKLPLRNLIVAVESTGPRASLGIFSNMAIWSSIWVIMSPIFISPLHGPAGLIAVIWFHWLSIAISTISIILVSTRNQKYLSFSVCCAANRNSYSHTAGKKRRFHLGTTGLGPGGQILSDICLRGLYV